MKVSIGTFFLSNGNNPPTEVGPFNLKIRSSRNVQVSEFLRGPKVETIPRLNHKTSVSFTVQREWSDADTASKFMLTHPLAIPDGGTAIFKTEGNANITMYLPKTSVQNVGASQIGVRTFHDYEILGGEFQTTRPTS